MKRRKFVICCLATSGMAGCLDDEPSNGNNGEESTNESDAENGDSKNNTETETDDSEDEPVEGYLIYVDSPTEDVDTDANVCIYDELSSAAQTEFNRTLEEDEVLVEEKPDLMETDCHNTYVKYEEKYYWVDISMVGG